MPSQKTFDRLDYTYKLLVVLALIITATILAKDIIIPIIFAGLLSIVMYPVVRRLENMKIPTTLAITLVLLVTITVMGLFVWLIIDQIASLVNDLPNLESRFQTFVTRLTALVQNFGISLAERNKIVGDAMKSVSLILGDVILSTTNVISAFIQIPIYIFLFLIYRDKFRDFFLSLIDSEELRWKKDVDRVVQGYISGLILVTLIVAALNSIGLLVLGIDHAIFFGILSGVLTIIPYVGIIIGALLPIIMALITKDSGWYAVGVIIVFSIVQFLEGNFITPRITGSKVSINALAAIIALLIGSKILGITGMILAVPCIGIFKIFLSHSAHLKPFVILLEDSPAKKDDVIDDEDDEVEVEIIEDPSQNPTTSQ